jgi:Domain of unknown function (DUF4062)
MPVEPKRKTAMISSTSLDLPEHRQQAIDACLRQGIFPRAMEHLPARDADAFRVSLEMVDEADIYIGIYAWRYGHVPEGHDISITEMELNRAVERGIPILVFTIHDNHLLTRTMVEADKEAQEKLKQLKERACQGRGRLEFKSPVELRSHIIQSLGALFKEEEATTQEKRALLHADALNVLAQLERDQGHRDAAVAAATEAYRQAWCDGPPYAYHFGLANARRHLRELGAPELQMPPFDAAKYAPMPEVELDPEDEFHVGKIAEA